MSLESIWTSLPILILAIGVGYLLGALPIADRISRRRDVDIFSTGTGLAGATNVRKSVGKLPSVIVLLGDFAKGALAVIVARLLGVEEGWVLLPAAAAIVGHWKSVFSGFRGGDALVTLGGIIIALFPISGVISVAVAILIALGGQKLPYTSLLNIVLGYATLAILNLAYGEHIPIPVHTPAYIPLTLGIGGLSAMVLAYALKGHAGRRQVNDWDDVTDAGGAAEQTEVRP